MYRSILFIVICFTLFAGCNTTNNRKEDVVKDTSVNISFVDAQGKDLLNSDRPNAITEQNTNLYYLIDGKKVKQFRGHLDYPKMFFISDEKLSDLYFMRVFANTIRDQDTTTTYLKFKDGSMDTIKVGYDYNGSSVAITKVWYNGDVRWDANGDNNNEENNEHVGRYFVVTKNFE